MTRIAIPLAAATIVLATVGCSGSEGKDYDISPVFPLSEDKCERYNGEEVGEGFGASCMVTKADCERAAADWNRAMREGGVHDAIQFSCR